MSGGVRRALADLACRILQTILPSSSRSWGQAIRSETAAIPDDTEALAFALSSLCRLVPRGVALRVLALVSVVSRELHGNRVHGASGTFAAVLSRPRELGIACAAGAVALGLVYLAMAGAPVRYLAVNFGALVVGCALLAVLDQARIATGPPQSGGFVAIPAALLATALFGQSVEGAARWISVGGLALQPSLVLLPVMLVGWARTRSPLATASLVAAAAAIALQPDRAMAAMLAAGIAVQAVMRADRHVLAALVAALAALSVTMLGSGSVPAVAHVDGVFHSAFAIHPLAGLAVLAGSALLLLPAMAGWRHDPAHRAAYAAFGIGWLVLIGAAALGNYPTPLTGYGGSAIIGYLLSLAALPKCSQPRRLRRVSSPANAPLRARTGRQLRLGTPVSRWVRGTVA